MWTFHFLNANTLHSDSWLSLGFKSLFFYTKSHKIPKRHFAATHSCTCAGDTAFFKKHSAATSNRKRYLFEGHQCPGWFRNDNCGHEMPFRNREPQKNMHTLPPTLWIHVANLVCERWIDWLLSSIGKPSSKTYLIYHDGPKHGKNKVYWEIRVVKHDFRLLMAWRTVTKASSVHTFFH